MQGDRERCLAAEMDDYLPKPVRLPDLETMLQRYLPPDAAGPLTADRSENTAVRAEAGPHAIDLAVLGRLADPRQGGDLALQQELIDLFLEESRPLVDGLRPAVDRDEPENVRRLAHSLKGISAHIGARPLQALCDQLERLGQNKTLADASGVWIELAAEYERACAELTNLRRPTGVNPSASLVELGTED
jgi:two-component system, sensor histidine kinase and response regulator